MSMNIREIVAQRLQELVGCKLSYGFKAADMDLYDLGFGEDTTIINYFNEPQEVPQFAIHFTCKLMLLLSSNEIIQYDRYTSHDTFMQAIEPLIGLPICNVQLRANNTLQIDLEPYKLQIIPECDEDECWRFFQPGQKYEHVVCYGNRIAME